MSKSSWILQKARIFFFHNLSELYPRQWHINKNRSSVQEAEDTDNLVLFCQPSAPKQNRSLTLPCRYFSDLNTCRNTTDLHLRKIYNFTLLCQRVLQQPQSENKQNPLVSCCTLFLVHLLYLKHCFGFTKPIHRETCLVHRKAKSDKIHQQNSVCCICSVTPRSNKHCFSLKYIYIFLTRITIVKKICCTNQLQHAFSTTVCMHSSIISFGGGRGFWGFSAS